MIRLAMTLGVCVALIAGTAVSATDEPPRPTNWFGAYLAAQQAFHSGDFAASAAYFQALTSSNHRAAVRTHAIAAFVANGDVGFAAELAREEVRDGGSGSSLLAYLIVADDLRRGNWNAARTLLDNVNPSGGMDGYVVPILRAWLSGPSEFEESVLAPVDVFADRGVLPSFFHYHAARIVADRATLAAATERYRKAIDDAAAPERVLLAAFAHFSAVADTETASAIQSRLATTFSSSGSVLTLREGGEVWTPAGYVRWHSDSPAPSDGSQAENPAGQNPVRGPVEIMGVAETFFDAARLLASRDFDRAALAHVRIALFLQPDFAEAHLLAGRILGKVDAVEGALTAYRRVRESSPIAWDADLELGRFLGDRGRIDEAEAVLVDLGNRHSERIGAFSTLGHLFASAEQYESAIEAFSGAVERVQQLESRHWPLLYGRGAAWERTGRWDLAEADFRRALELVPDQPLVLNYLAYSWIEQGKHLEEARDMAARAVELRPDNGFIIDSLGWAYFRLGDYETAVTTLERAMEAEPGDPVITSHYGDALWRVGREFEARLQWRSALRSDPDPELAAEIERKLEHGFDYGAGAFEEQEI